MSDATPTSSSRFPLILLVRCLVTLMMMNIKAGNCGTCGHKILMYENTVGNFVLIYLFSVINIGEISLIN